SSQGMSWEALVSAAQSTGAGTKGLVGANGYRTWAIEDLKRELALGHPVLLLLRYRLIPDHVGSTYDGDHYVVALGFDQQGNLVYNDPAGTVAHGDRRRLTPTELDDAWSNTWAGYVRTALALYR
ncbi:MAG TPA: C39 family peptidase, partial [Chloroflexota bacterium]|nr:C39 family peptidase [Chloroflexota bacterium]